jgi:hypothetical protein
VVCSAFVAADLSAAVCVGTGCCCALVGVLLTGANTISMATLCELSMSVVLGDSNKQAIANTCNATTHSTTTGVVRGTDGGADA